MNNYELANSLIGNGTLDAWTGKVLGVAQALADGTLVWDGTRANGKGGFKGTSSVADAVAAVNPDVAELKSYAGQVSKIGRGIMEYGAFVVGVTDSERESAAREFARTFTLNQLSELLYPKTDDDKWSLVQAVATLLAAANKREVSMEAVLAEVVGQIEADA